MLIGSTEMVLHSSRPNPTKNTIPPIKIGLKKDKSTSKLYELRNSLKDFKINPLASGLVNTRPRFLSGYSKTTYVSAQSVTDTVHLDAPPTADFSNKDVRIGSRGEEGIESSEVEANQEEHDGHEVTETQSGDCNIEGDTENTSAIQNTGHQMITRSKAGIYKPKVYLT
ncbi:unnamed protein product [Fraxinus pennsylvanica]|uniref:Uncharacterized protein n=1 Tax=Fraxinus pennsylvanica TaxID=56036 RepID=A0AAD2E0P7_9LAMI|nr:unnamed protein product [Fraxinus pennsylvanica]